MMDYFPLKYPNLGQRARQSPERRSSMCIQRVQCIHLDRLAIKFEIQK